MRKIAPVLLAALLAIGCMFAVGCSQEQKQAPEGGSSQSTQEQAAGGKDGQVLNPLVESDKAGVLEATGLELDPPADAAKGSAAYFYIDMGEDAAPIAELRFTDANGVEFTYRAQSSSSTVAEDISGMNYAWSAFAKPAGNVAHLEATYSRCPDATVCTWFDVAPGINYSLSCDTELSKDEMLAVANSIFVPTQGEV